MAISVTHSHVSEVADDPGFDVSSGEWNAAHTITGAAEAYQATSFPGSPTEGLLCYRTDRHVLYQYTGSVWAPIASHAAMTIYVDPTGTDDDAHGWASGTDAYATIGYTLSQVPALYGGNVTVNIAAGTYAESPVIRGKTPTGPYELRIVGTMTTVLSDTMTSGSRGTIDSGSQASITKTAAGWTADAYKRMICKLTSGTNNGETRIIEGNTSTALTLVGNILAAAPSSGDTFDILSFGSIVTGTISIYSACCMRYLQCTNPVHTYGGPTSMDHCHFYQLNCWGQTMMTGTSFVTGKSIEKVVLGPYTTGPLVVDGISGGFRMKSCYINASAAWITLLRSFQYMATWSCVFDAGGYNCSGGMLLIRGQMEVGRDGTTDLNTILKNTTGTGLRVDSGGIFLGTSRVTYLTVSTTTPSVETATYSVAIA